MARPDVVVERFDLSLSYDEFSLKSDREGYAGLKIFAPLAVGKRDGSFRKVDLKSLLGKVEDTQRAPRAAYNRDSFKWTKDTFSLEDHGVEEVVDQEDNERWYEIIQNEQYAAERAVHRVAMALENDIKTVVEAWSNSTTVSNKWDTSNGTPLADIRAGIKAVKARVGRRPNLIEMTDYCWQVLSESDEFVAKIKTGNPNEPVKMTEEAFKRWFNIDHLIISDGYYNANDNVDNDTSSLTQLWADSKVFIGCQNYDGMTGDLNNFRPSVGRTLFEAAEMPNGMGVDGAMSPSMIMEEYADPQHRGDVIRARNHRQVKTLHTDAGQILDTVL